MGVMTGRPRSFDRDQALVIAMEHCWREGFAATSVADLTAGIGIKPPSLYAAFGSKEELFEEAAELYFDGVMSNVDRALGRSTARDSLGELLRISAEAYVDGATPPGCLLMSEPRLARQRQVLSDRIAERLEKGIDDGDLPGSLDASDFAAFIVSVTVGMSRRARDGGTLEQLRSIAQVALSAVPDLPRE